MSHSTLQGKNQQCDWTEFYPGVSEKLPVNMTTHKDKGGPMTLYVDSNYTVCKETRRSITGVLVLVNNTPICGYCKRQSTVETCG